jgi:hypothetical membrane protein
MNIEFFKRPLLSVGGLLVILLYCSFTFTSWAFYPEPFAPWTHYLSRLGDFNYSPFGAYFYNLGCILTGSTLILFFVGLRSWYAMHRAARGMLILGQIIGFLASFALILIGVFSEDQGAPHMTASSIFFILNFIVMILVNIALMFHSRFFKLIGAYGILMTLFSLPLEIVIGGPLIEWYTVFGSLVFVGLLAYNTAVMNRYEKVQTI